MAIPILKVILATYKYASKPLNNILIKAFKTRGRDSYIRYWFESFGQLCHRMEVKINRNIIRENNPLIQSDEEERLKFYIKPLNSESAFNKGVENMIEFVVLYASLFLITVIEIRKSYIKAAQDK